MKSEITLVPGKTSDAKAFYAFRTQTHVEGRDFNTINPVLAGELIKTYSKPGYHVFFLKDGEKIIGQLFLRLTEKTELNIGLITVLESYRRKGLGTQLLEKAEEIAEQHKVLKVTLFVKKDNLPAQALYFKNGFEITGTANTKTFSCCRWRMPVVSRVLIIKQNTVFVMLRNGYLASHPGVRWIFPGGQADPEERSVDSVIRETNEEIGLSLKESDLTLIFERYDTTYNKQMTFYAAKAPVKDPTLKEPKKFDKAEWVALKDIKSLNGKDGGHIGVFMVEAVSALQKKGLISRW